MQENNRKIESFIDERLRNSRTAKASEGFSSLLMKRIAAEHSAALEESKGDRLVKYIIGSFSTLIIGVSVVLAAISGSSVPSGNTPTGVNFTPAMETTGNYFQRFLGFIESAFLSVLNFFGLAANSKTFTIIIFVVLVALVFLAAERFILHRKLRSSGAVIK